MSEDMRDDIEQQDGEVGYCRPPKHSQFKKGVSGNPSGRPKKAPDFDTQLLRELDSKMIVSENGKRRRISKSTVILKQMANRASNGHLPTQRLVIPLYMKARERDAEKRQSADELAKLSYYEKLEHLSDAELMQIAKRGGTLTHLEELGVPKHHIKVLEGKYLDPADTDKKEK